MYRLLFLLMLFAWGHTTQAQMPDVNPDSLEAEVLRQINELRTQAGLAALERHPLLDELAERHSANMKDYAFFDHIDQNGEDPQERKDFDFPEIIGLVTESIAYEYATDHKALATKMVDWWLEKKKRARPLYDASHNYIGVGAVQDLDGVYLTVEYGSLLAELVSTLPPDTVSAGDSLSLIYRYLAPQVPRNAINAYLLFPYPDPKKGSQYVGSEALRPEWFDRYFRIRWACNHGPGLYSFVIGPGQEMAPGGVVVEVVR